MLVQVRENCKELRKHFNNDEFLNIINAMFYSKLYYACQVWLLPNISNYLKRKLLNISSQALKIIGGEDFALFSFNELHILYNRATPNQWINYVNANQLYSLINNCKPESLWIELQEKISINNRTSNFYIEKTNNTRYGKNCFLNRLQNVENNLNFNEFNYSKSTFKVHCKKTFFQNLFQPKAENFKQLNKTPLNDFNLVRF